MRVVMLVLFALLAPGAAQAETRAWLDRDRIVLGESATLNVETDQATVSAPSYDALRGDFRLSGHSSRRSLERRNGRTVSRSLFAWRWSRGAPASSASRRCRWTASALHRSP